MGPGLLGSVHVPLGSVYGGVSSAVQDPIIGVPQVQGAGAVISSLVFRCDSSAVRDDLRAGHQFQATATAFVAILGVGYMGQSSL